MSKKHPILFFAPMVRAILDGRKTQTRRVVTCRNTLVDGGTRWSKEGFACFDLNNAWVDPGPSPAGNPGPYLKAEYMGGWKDHPAGTVHRLYPQWQVGDGLWIRETWAIDKSVDHAKPSDLAAWSVKYAADDTIKIIGFNDTDFGRTRPSIHMPRWASRIDLEVKAVWPEHVQDITPEDVYAEGLQNTGEGWGPEGRLGSVAGFRDLWDSINAKRGFGWDTNPWVWVDEFSSLRKADKDAVED